ncbi:MAG: DMT family transporter [Gammaproteobacteria bacterium]|nr:DMT family transporter [Gammaproteobacteria bacterium]
MHSDHALHWRPTAALLIGATLWGITWYPMRLLESAGLSGLWLNVILYGAASSAGLVFARRQLAALIHRPLLLLLIALTAGWANLAFVLAILDGNVLRVLLLFYLSPVWAVLWAWVLLKEPIQRSALGVLALAICGAIVMLWQPGDAMPWPRDTTDWLALSSGFAFATSNSLVRLADDVPVVLKSLAVWVGALLLAAFLIVLLPPSVPVFNFTTVIGATALGLFGMVTMTWLVQYGVSHMPVHRSAIILLFELVVGAISQQVLTHEVVTSREWWGGLMVVAAAALSAWYARGEQT